MVESQNLTSDLTQKIGISWLKPMTFRFVSKIRMVARKKISSPQFLSYDHQNFFGKTLDNLEGRHVFVFSILYHKKNCIHFFLAPQDFFTQEPKYQLSSSHYCGFSNPDFFQSTTAASFETLESAFRNLFHKMRKDL